MLLNYDPVRTGTGAVSAGKLTSLRNNLLLLLLQKWCYGGSRGWKLLPPVIASAAITAQNQSCWEKRNQIWFSSNTILSRNASVGSRNSSRSWTGNGREKNNAGCWRILLKKKQQQHREDKKSTTATPKSKTNNANGPQGLFFVDPLSNGKKKTGSGVRDLPISTPSGSFLFDLW